MHQSYHASCQGSSLPPAVARVLADVERGARRPVPPWLVALLLKRLPAKPTERHVADALADLIVEQIDRARGKPSDPFLRAALRKICGPGGRWTLPGRRR